ncbi:MAG: cadmium-translocating P-type ATPase [Gammaproteobacteria bacterium]|nr:cadmium-translocating P-type ATPase [Gammaproteobacteria bacterium]
MATKKSDSHSTLISVEGMSCAGCVRSVETALSSVAGVHVASVNFASQTAAVVGVTPVDELIEAVRKAGYEAKPFENVSLTEQDEAIRRAFALSAGKSALALAGGLLLMADMYLSLLPGIGNNIAWSLIGLVVLAIMFLTGGHFFRGALAALQNRTATMDTLIALGTGTAWVYSMTVVLIPDVLPAESRHQFFEAALFVIGFVNLGKALETHARSRASLAIQRLFDLTPKFVTRISGGADELVPVEVLVHGDEVRVKPGDCLPVDGEVIDGYSSVDESMLTGESEALLKQSGSIVRAGTVNLDGSLIIRAEGVGAETLLAGMVRLITEAQNSKPRIARLVDQISAVFVPAVILLAILTATLWALYGPEPVLSYSLVTGMSVLIIACPCALGLAIPMSVMVGLGRAATDGLLVRNSEVLQTAANLTMVVLDKTGTITRGEPVVVRSEGVDEKSLSLALGLEILSEHPLAKAIVDYGMDKNISAADVTGFESHVGGGVTGRVGTQNVALGSEVFLRLHGAENFPLPVKDVGSVVYLMIEQDVVGYFLLQDAIREDAAAAVAEMKEKGVRVVMLSGDRREVAAQVAEKVGIEEVFAGLLPEDKLGQIRLWQSQGEIVGMVGDGINDAAALSAADVGFAMGEGTDIAMESADITLLGESLGGIARSIYLSRRIVRNIRQNLIAAFAYNILLIPVAAGILFPFTGLLINPALAGFAMAMSSVSVVFNAGRLRFA